MAIRVFGLTGGIGSGKTTVANRWRSRNLPIIDADVLAKEVVAIGTPGLQKVVDEFGDEILTAGGALDRSTLARLVFQDPLARKRLEGITHPLVSEALEQAIKKLDAQGEPLICYEASLLVETGRAEAFRPLVVVKTPDDVRVVRTMHRDGFDEAHARSRLSAQGHPERKLEMADHVIDNGGTLAETIDQADAVLDRICRNEKLDPSRYPRPPMDAAE